MKPGEDLRGVGEGLPRQVVEGRRHAGGVDLVDGVMAPGQPLVVIWGVEEGSRGERGLLGRWRLRWGLGGLGGRGAGRADGQMLVGDGNRTCCGGIDVVEAEDGGQGAWRGRSRMAAGAGKRDGGHGPMPQRLDG